MLPKIKIIFVAILLFAAVFVVLQFFFPDRSVSRLFTKNGTLQIESVPRTNVFINSTLSGQTPMQTSLKEGVYTVKLVPEASEAKTISWSSTVRVYKGTTTYINRELASNELLSGGEILSLEKNSQGGAMIWVNTDPSGVFVSLDGEDRGVSPAYIENVATGQHELSVRDDGLLPRTIKVIVVPDHKLIVDFKLMRDENFKEKQNQKKKKEPKEEAKLLKILETPTGWLRVRSEPSLGASESAQVVPGEEYKFYTVEENWYQIEYEEGKRGWVYGDYIEEVLEAIPTLTPTPEEDL
jgi:hypothetical protein